MFNNTIFDRDDKVELGTDQGHCVRVVPGTIWNCHLSVQVKLFSGVPAYFAISGPLYDSMPSSPGTFVGGLQNQTKVGRSVLEPLANERYRFTLTWDD